MDYLRQIRWCAYSTVKLKKVTHFSFYTLKFVVFIYPAGKDSGTLQVKRATNMDTEINSRTWSESEIAWGNTYYLKSILAFAFIQVLCKKGNCFLAMLAPSFPTKIYVLPFQHIGINQFTTIVFFLLGHTYLFWCCLGLDRKCQNRLPHEIKIYCWKKIGFLFAVILDKIPKIYIA